MGGFRASAPAQYLQIQTHAFSWPLAPWGLGRGPGAADWIPGWALGCGMVAAAQAAGVRGAVGAESGRAEYLLSADPSTLILPQLERRLCTAGTDRE